MTGDATDFDLTNGYPKLVVSQLSLAQLALWKRLPADYQRFLLAHNGGSAEAGRCVFSTGVPFRTEAVDNPSGSDGVRAFYGFDTTGGDGEEPGDLLALAQIHEQERFLPRDVITIGICEQSSLVCISLRPDTYGSVWYWHWYWKYPWCKFFFEERIAEAKREHVSRIAAIDDLAPHEYAEIEDALNFATIVRQANTFTDWLKLLMDKREAFQ
jgi:hypothetical protein